MMRNVVHFFTLGRRREVEIFPTYKETLKKVCYGDIVKAIEWFSPFHRISSTRIGSVYVGRFEFDSDLVAIKIFNSNEHGAHESYLTECGVLRSVRHRNILKCVASCSTWDTENNEFKALVFQFMPNGSLERWLHPSKRQNGGKLNRTLSLGQRICIVTDVACALDYFHNQLTPPLVHCDLKPSNVLLDYDMTARVGDFGSAKFLSQDSGGLKRLVSIQGTIGYLAPGEPDVIFHHQLM
jgi:serine/threonine protein kinase